MVFRVAKSIPAMTSLHHFTAKAIQNLLLLLVK